MNTAYSLNDVADFLFEPRWGEIMTMVHSIVKIIAIIFKGTGNIPYVSLRTFCNTKQIAPRLEHQ